MADSLDDFFAKKDKSKKGKSKSKYTTSATIAKKLEDGGKKLDVFPRKDTKEKIQYSSNNQSIMTPSISNEQEDDEWKNVEEKETDYSGLRIQALSIVDKEKEEEQLKEQMLSEQNGENSKLNDGQSGPWRVVSTPSSETPTEEKDATEPEQPPQPAASAEETPKPAGTYKPPAMRNAALGSGTPTVPFGSAARRSRHAPQISSELHFPSLSNAADSKFKIEVDRNFQAVKHGVKSKGEGQKEVKLDLENKFAALHQND